MEPVDRHRRNLIMGSLGAVGVQLLPEFAQAQSPSRIRLEWQQFKKTSQYQSFLNAIAVMRKNTNPSDQGSLQYWANAHQVYCPHGIPYFISWHRGYLYYFEQQLRISSGDPTLNLPYWDYYSYANLPTEFTDPTPGNPLYMQRTGVNVYNALDMTPFASGVFNFQRGTTNSFEVKIENAPHNPVHDLIGGIMSTMQSPLDPIFFLHHANIDRLTHAWALPDGKGIPYTAYPYSSTNSNSYWAGSNVYASNLSIERYKTCDPTWLGYDYSNDKMPTSRPPLSVTAQAGRGQLLAPQRPPSNERPPFKPIKRTPGRVISATRRSLGGAAGVAFDEQSISIGLSLTAKDATQVANLIAAYRDGNGGGGNGVLARLKFVFDGASLSDAGRLGGYFYALFLNMPPVVDSQNARDKTFLGTLGAFQIAMASHHGLKKLEVDMVDLLVQQQISDFSDISLSWIRVDGDNPPAGKMIGIDEARIELSFDPEPSQPPGPNGPPGWYR